MRAETIVHLSDWRERKRRSGSLIGAPQTIVPGIWAAPRGDELVLIEAIDGPDIDDVPGFAARMRRVEFHSADDERVVFPDARSTLLGGRSVRIDHYVLDPADGVECLMLLIELEKAVRFMMRNCRVGSPHWYVGLHYDQGRRPLGWSAIVPVQ